MSLPGGYGEYINKRLWRIAPLYYFWIGAAIFADATSTYWQEQFAVSVDAYNIFMHLSFLSFLDYKIAATILGVEWTIPIEVFWYFLIPLCMLYMKNRKHLVIAIFLSTSCYWLADKYPTLLAVPSKDAALAMHWSPIPYALGFCLGIAAFRLRESGTQYARRGDIALVAVILMLVALSLRPASKFDYVLFSISTFVLILFGSNKSQFLSWLFANRIVMYLGTISYGIYLSHFPLLAILVRLNLVAPSSDPEQAFLILSGSAILVSFLTYYLIERPCLVFGKSSYSRYKNILSQLI